MNMRSSLAIGIAALCLGTTPAMASNFTGTNNSNVSGVNNSNPQGVPSFGTPASTGSAGYNSSVLETGQACTGTRSFLRTPQTCPTNEKLIKAKADATAFLESVKTPGPNLLATPQGVVAKANPTW
jgi:hypothetical protein